MILRPIEAESPDISVIIPTVPLNHHDKVVDCLKSQSTNGFEFEVIIVNNPDINVCEARNFGLKVSNGNIVAFTDDDCRPPVSWLEAIYKTFAKIDDLVLLEGPVEGGMIYDGFRKYPTCNLAVDREAALESGGFDNRFNYWREDTEFGWRLEKYGNYIFADSVRMIHPDSSRSSIIKSNEQLLREEYPLQYEEIIIPDTIVGRVNNLLWQQGFWELVDRIRYKS